MNILFVTYYYKPLNVVASNRVNAQVRALKKHVEKVTVISRFWSDDAIGMSKILEETQESKVQLVDNLKEVYIPFVYKKKKLDQSSLAYKLNIYKGYLSGNYAEVQGIEHNYLQPILNELSKEKYDLIIYSVNPFGFIPLAKKIYESTGINYTIDFRDLISAKFLKKKNNCLTSIFKKKVFGNLKKQLAPALFLSSVSDPILDQLNQVNSSPKHLIYNGYDDRILDQIEDEAPDSIFTLSYMGNFYLQLDYKPLFNTLLKWLSEDKSRKFIIHFIGTSEEIVNQLIEEFPELPIKHTKWLPYIDAIKLAKKSDVLINQSWRNYDGILGGKLFDYFGLRRNILVYPGESTGIMEKLILKVNAGSTPPAEEELMCQLNKWYEEKQKNGAITYSANEKIIRSFSRSNQSNNYCNIVKSMIRPKVLMQKTSYN